MNKQRISRTAGAITLLLFVFILVFSRADESLQGALLNPLLYNFFMSTDDVLVPKMSIISSIIIFLSSITMIIAGVFSDRKSRIFICFSGIVVYSIFSILTAFTPTGFRGYIYFFLARSLSGIGTGAIIPAIFSMVGDTAKSDKRTMAFAYINIAMGVGQLVGLMMGGFMQSTWRVAYGITGGTGLLLAFFLIFRPEPQRGATETELQGTESAAYIYKFELKDFKEMWTNKTNFWLIANFVDTIPSGIILFLLFKYLEDDKNMDPEITTIIFIIAFLAGFIGTLVFGWIGDKWFRKNKRAKVIIALFCNGFPILFFIIFLLIPFYVPYGATFGEALSIPGVAFAVGMLVILMAINQGVGPNWDSTLTDVNLPEHRSTMLGMASFMDLIGRTIGPLLAGLFTSVFSLQGAMWAAVGFWALNVVLWLPVFAHVKNDLKKVHDTLEERAKLIKSI
jgi:MFS family permease